MLKNGLTPRQRRFRLAYFGLMAISVAVPCALIAGATSTSCLFFSACAALILGTLYYVDRRTFLLVAERGICLSSPTMAVGIDYTKISRVLVRVWNGHVQAMSVYTRDVRGRKLAVEGIHDMEKVLGLLRQRMPAGVPIITQDYGRGLWCPIILLFIASVSAGIVASLIYETHVLLNSDIATYAAMYVVLFAAIAGALTNARRYRSILVSCLVLTAAITVMALLNAATWLFMYVIG